MAASAELFSELAKALSQPSHAYRAATEGLGIPVSALEGYLGGLGAGKTIRQSKFATSPAGSYFNDNTLPYNFKPDTSVEDFTALEPFAKPNVGMVANFISPDQAKVLGVDPKVIDAFGGKPIPRQVAQSNITKQQADTKNGILGRMAGARESAVELSAQKAATQYGGGAAAQPAIKESFNRIAQVQRTRGLLDQIRNQGGRANPQQRAELAMSTARTLNPSGVLTNEAMDMMLPQSAVGKYGNAMQYMQNAPYDTDFAQFANRFSDLLDREEVINKKIVQSGGQYAAPFARFGADVQPPEDMGGSQGNPNIPTGVPGQGTGTPQGMVHIRDSQGGEHYLPQGAFGNAKQRDPGLQVIQ
jgi:hypothetical protein